MTVPPATAPEAPPVTLPGDEPGTEEATQPVTDPDTALVTPPGVDPGPGPGPDFGADPEPPADPDSLLTDDPIPAGFMPGGSDISIPPVPTMEGHTVVPNGSDYSFIELDDMGVPLGEWTFDPDEELWIFDPAVPLGMMPGTGLEDNVSRLLMLFGLALLGAAAAVVMIKRERGRTK